MSGSQGMIMCHLCISKASIKCVNKACFIITLMISFAFKSNLMITFAHTIDIIYYKVWI